MSKVSSKVEKVLKRILLIAIINFVSLFFVISGLTVQGDNSSLNGIGGALLSPQNMPKFNMTYIHYNDKASYIRYVENANGSINEVAPNYFNLSKKGDLILSKTIDKDFINEMHSRNIRVVPYLSNDWDRISGKLAISKRYKLADEIAKIIIDYNLDGINIDIENLTEKDRDRYVDFVKVLRKKLPADSIIAVAVAANPRGLTTGWHGSYNYEELGKYADYLMVMTYDEHYGGSPPGPVASIDFVENSIKYALEKVPKDKIVLGIPFYGRMWRSVGGMKGQGISLKFAEGLIAKYKGDITFNNNYLSPKAIITIKSGDEKPIVNGAEIRPGTYTIWYENEQSIKHKLSLVKKYDLKGTGSWSLGQETQSIWNYYNLWLNGYYYSDCQGHWAQNPIILALNNGWITSKTTKDSSGFAPDKPITRAEVAVALVRAFQLEKNKMNMQKITLFNDISSHWAKEEIEIAVENRIIMGKIDGSFAPDDVITKEELSVILDRMLSANKALTASISRSGGTSTKHNYSDVTRETCVWSYDSIVRISQQGILQGSIDGKFGPNESITRAKMAELLYKMLSD
jgi:spore germination protein YaaH